MNIITILLFFVYTYGFGFSITYLFKIKDEADFIEKNVMRLGLGLAMMIVILVILNMFKIPLYWWLILILSQVVVIYALINYFFKKKENAFSSKKIMEFKFNKTNVIYLLLLLLFSFNLFMYVSGSFSYQYLEDDDPWTHAREMKYVAVEKRLDVDYFRPINYLDPYPPAYAAIMGLMHQTSPDAQWTLKFFNCLLISLSILFFFFLVKSLTKSENIALSSTFVLSLLPSYLSHFIWSHTLIPLLFCVLMYCYIKIDEDKKWWIISGVITAAVMLTHTRQVIKIAIMAGIFFGVKWVYQKKFPKEIIYSAVIGLILSLSWWAFKFTSLMKMLTYSSSSAATNSTALVNTSQSLIMKFISRFPSMFSATGGTATRPYTFSDFFIATKSNMINSPIGWGIIISLLLILALFLIALKYKKLKEPEYYWISLVGFWFLFTFLIVNSATFNLPVGLEAFRTWMLLAVPVSILAGYGLVLIVNSFKSNLPLKILVLCILILGIIFTAGYQKYYHNTNPNWPPGGKWTSMDELNGYIWMKNNLPLNSMVFTYSSQNKVVYGFNMDACVWCETYRNFQETVINQDLTTVYRWLKTNQYEYLAFGGMEYKYLGKIYGDEIAKNKINAVLDEIAKSPQSFKLVYQNNGFVLFKII